MSFRHGSRVKMTSTTTGAGTLTVVAAAAEFRDLNTAYGAGPVKVPYVIRGTTYFEIGIGTFTNSGATLSRDTILLSSAGGSAVTLPAATHDIFIWETGIWPSDVYTGSPTLNIADLFGLILYTGTGGTAGLPALANLPRGIVVPFVNLGSGTLTFDPNGAETINGAASLAVAPNQGGWLFTRDTATAQWLAIVAPVANPAALDVAQTFTAAQTIANALTVTGSGLTPVTAVSTDAGAGEGPIVDRYRDSASPAANDLIAADYDSGRSSTAVKRQYAKRVTKILDPTNASEDAETEHHTVVAGTLAARMVLGAGLRIGSPTGGDPGVGKLNAVDLQIDGGSVLEIAARAWARLDVSSGTPSVTSKNVTSVDDDGVGLFGINLSFTMASVGYAIVAYAEAPGANLAGIVSRNTTQAAKSTTAFDIRCTRSDVSSASDNPDIGVAVFR